MIHKGAQRVTKDTKGIKDHTIPQSYTKPYPTISYPNYLIKRGSQTACNHKLDDNDSYTLCKG
jgi:hypothetical protein